MREEVFLLGRVLFSLVLIMSGANHLIKTEPMSQYAAYKGVPNAKLMVQLSGVASLLGGLAIVLGIWMDLAGLGVAILMVIYAVKMHNFWTVEDPQAQAAEQASFMKNISMAGAGLIIATFAYAPYTITDGVF